MFVIKVGWMVSRERCSRLHAQANGTFWTITAVQRNGSAIASEHDWTGRDVACARGPGTRMLAHARRVEHTDAQVARSPFTCQLVQGGIATEPRERSIATAEGLHDQVGVADVGLPGPGEGLPQSKHSVIGVRAECRRLFGEDGGI